MSDQPEDEQRPANEPLFLREDSEDETDIITEDEESPAESAIARGDMFDDSWVIKHDKLRPRHRTLARLLADGRYNQNQIAEHLNYQPAWISTLRRHPKIKEAVSFYHERAFQSDHSDRMKDLAGEAIDVIEETIRDTSGVVKPAEKQAAAKWLIEKVTGKAVQVHDVGESTLVSVLDAIDRINAGKPIDALSFDRKTKDVTPADAEREQNPLKKWISEET